jgi:hypothetical protein
MFRPTLLHIRRLISEEKVHEVPDYLTEVISKCVLLQLDYLKTWLLTLRDAAAVFLADVSESQRDDLYVQPILKKIEEEEDAMVTQDSSVIEDTLPSQATKMATLIGILSEMVEAFEIIMWESSHPEFVRHFKD